MSLGYRNRSCPSINTDAKLQWRLPDLFPEEYQYDVWGRSDETPGAKFAGPNSIQIGIGNWEQYIPANTELREHAAHSPAGSPTRNERVQSGCASVL